MTARAISGVGLRYEISGAFSPTAVSFSQWAAVTRSASKRIAASEYGPVSAEGRCGRKEGGLDILMVNCSGFDLNEFDVQMSLQGTCSYSSLLLFCYLKHVREEFQMSERTLSRKESNRCAGAQGQSGGGKLKIQFMY